MAQPFNVTVLATTPTQAILSYTAPDNNACSVAVSSSSAINQFTGAFISLVHDVDPLLFPGADSDTKAGNIVNGTQRTIVVGHRGVGDGSDGNIYSLALQAATTHYFRISCDNGAYVGTGSFLTADIPLGDSAPDTIPYDANGFGGYGWPTVDFANQSTKYVDPQTGALLQRLTGSEDQMYAQFNNQALNAPVDLSGGAWANLVNLGYSSDGAVTTYTGAGGPSNGIFLPLSSVGLARYSFNSNAYSALDDINLHLHGSGDPVLACLSDDDGQTCLGTPFTLTLPPSTPGDVSGPGNYPAPLFQGWGNAHVTSDMLANGFGANATLTGNSLVWNSGTDGTGQTVYFPVTTLKPGTIVEFAGTYYHVASVQDQQHVTLVESVSSPITGYGLLSRFRHQDLEAAGRHGYCEYRLGFDRLVDIKYIRNGRSGIRRYRMRWQCDGNVRRGRNYANHAGKRIYVHLRGELWIFGLEADDPIDGRGEEDLKSERIVPGWWKFTNELLRL